MAQLCCLVHCVALASAIQIILLVFYLVTDRALFFCLLRIGHYTYRSL